MGEPLFADAVQVVAGVVAGLGISVVASLLGVAEWIAAHPEVIKVHLGAGDDKVA